MRHTACAILAVALLAPWARADILQVPAQYAGIQAAIQAAQPGDTVLVADGVYHETVDFAGKAITVASHFLLDRDSQHIFNTIIDGSQPARPDTASCVLFVHGEGNGALLEGFTLRGGRGTLWLDEHGAGLYREGGGILIQAASPTIRHNWITDNEATATGPGVSSAGGGAIRCGDGNPLIHNNVITRNRGRYGAGIVLNFSGADIRNNVIALNEGGEDYGGAGIWCYGAGPAAKWIEHNSIAGNLSLGAGGGVLIWSAQATLRDNILWGNEALGPGSQIRTQGGTATVDHCDVEGGYTGVGNLDSHPLWTDALWLGNASPCIDAGNPACQDAEDPQMPGTPLWPARGDLRCDLGATGGPGVSPALWLGIPRMRMQPEALDFGLVEGGTRQLELLVLNRGTFRLMVDSLHVPAALAGELSVTGPAPTSVAPFTSASYHVGWTPGASGALADTLWVYHRNQEPANPLAVPLSGEAALAVDPGGVRPLVAELEPCRPNPFNPDTEISFTNPEAQRVRLTVLDLRGARVAVLLDEFCAPGRRSLRWRAGEAAGGLYLLRLELGGRVLTSKALLVK
jgi:hypothetical protein